MTIATPICFMLFPHDIPCARLEAVTMSDPSKIAMGIANNSNEARTSLELRLMLALLTNDRDHPVAAKDFPLSKRSAPRLGCIAWFVVFVQYVTIWHV